MKELIKACIEFIRIPSPLGDLVEFQPCSNYPDCGPECLKNHEKSHIGKTPNASDKYKNNNEVEQ